MMITRICHYWYCSTAAKLTELVTDAVVGPSVIFDSNSSPLGPLNVVTAKTITFRGVLTSGNVDRGNYVF